MMSFWQAVALGAVQGITEFLPVSSSGHLVLLRGILEVGEVPLLFDVLLHLSTLAATVVVFRARLRRLLAAGVDLLRPTERRRSAAGALPATAACCCCSCCAPRSPAASAWRSDRSGYRASRASSRSCC